ncbi:tRNA (N6-threonylcarbamoyladenosine(37)-N6)-methyltransferase TrmO [Marinobacteraceae bacterium S3BR75-40.1]
MTDGAPSTARYEMAAIGVVHSCFKEKFGIPRQPGLTRHAYGTIELYPPYNRVEALRGLESFSHLWVEFIFHQNAASERVTARPPRLGGNQRMGVLATRSSFRPNRLGLSVVELVSVEHSAEGSQLVIKGLDLVEGTPVLDIKPYLPYADAPKDARSGWVQSPPAPAMTVTFAPGIDDQLEALEQAGYRAFRELIIDILSFDPRPAYRQGKDDQRHYGIRLYDFDVRWHLLEPGKIEVTTIDSQTVVKQR